MHAYVTLLSSIGVKRTNQFHTYNTYTYIYTYIGYPPYINWCQAHQPISLQLSQSVWSPRRQKSRRRRCKSGTRMLMWFLMQNVTC